MMLPGTALSARGFMTSSRIHSGYVMRGVSSSRRLAESVIPVVTTNSFEAVARKSFAHSSDLYCTMIFRREMIEL